MNSLSKKVVNTEEQNRTVNPEDNNKNEKPLASTPAPADPETIEVVNESEAPSDAVVINIQENT